MLITVILTVLLSLAALSTLCFFLLNNEWLFVLFSSAKYQTFFSALSSVSNTLMVIVAVINLVAILYFYRISVQRRYNEERASNRQYWFRTVLLEGNFSHVELFFRSAEEIINECAQKLSQYRGNVPDSDVSRLYGRYTDAKIAVSYRFVDMANAMDEELGKQLNLRFEVFQDELTTALDCYLRNAGQIDQEKLIDLIHRQKSGVVKLLYTYGMNGGLTSEKKISFLSCLFDSYIAHEQNRFRCSTRHDNFIG